MYRCLTFFTLVLNINFSTAQQFLFSKQWDKRFGGTAMDVCSWIISTNDGGYLLGGGSQSGISGDKTQANWDTTLQFGDYWVVKVDEIGNKQWDKRFGGFNQDNLYVARQTIDGGYLLGGSSGSGMGGDKTQAGWGGWDYWIVKIDSVGNKQWDKRYGGTIDDIFWDLQQTADGGYILGGYSNSGISGDKTQEDRDPTHFYGDYWVVKIDSVGNKQWDKRFGGIMDESLQSIIQTNDGGYVLGGFSSSDSSGDKTQHTRGYSDYWVVKIDSVGNKEWDKRFGGTDGEGISSVVKTNDGGYILAGSSDSNAGGDITALGCVTGLYYWLVKINDTGNKEWDKAYGSTAAEGLQHIEHTNDGGYLLSGSSTTATASCDKSENNLGFSQTWVVKIDSMGNKKWDKTIFTTGTENNVGHAIQSKDGCYVVGSYTGAGIGGYKSQPSWDSGGDYWILKFCMDTVTGIDEITNQPQIVVYPNPFTSDISISLQIENLHQATFTISNLVGQTIYRREETNLANNYTKMLDLSYLPTGMYLLTVTTDGYRISKQIIKQ